MARFETVSDETIKKGECTDIYFMRTEETLRWENINPVVFREVTASALPDAWAVF
jgi:nicotinic acid phosphoribosyltransferase